MKKVVLKTYGKVIVWLLTVFGFASSCETTPTESRPEYGTPSADYVIKGKITDKNTRQPIKGLHVIRQSRWNKDRGNDTVRTTADGMYELRFNEIQRDEIKIYADDLDGTENGGKYKTDTLKIKVSDLKRIKKSDGRWYLGAFEKNDANFNLTKQTADAMYGVLSTEYKQIKNTQE